VATVIHVVDGDTVDLDTGERVRYLLVDAPESVGGTPECYGDDAKRFNTDLVLSRKIELFYDVERTDRFGRTLAYVTVDGHDVNALLVQRGYACVFAVPPNGDQRRDHYEALEAMARSTGRGLWGQCPRNPCD